ncbi:MAG: hypothetical protein JRJ19_10920 [Deltaproteobacteria bacterium]|nr:hypothetical protein [Deltaproteobacteria bacterium]
MKARFQVFAMMVLMGAATMSARASNTLSRPERATIYRDGYAVLEEKLGRMEPQAAIQLPAETDLTSVQVSLGGKYLSSVQIEELIEEVKTTEKTMVGGQVVLEKPVTTKKRVGYLLRPGISGPVGKGKLILRYGTTGINWQPQLGAEILDKERVVVTLTALVTNNALDLRNCRIYLASSAGALPSRIYFVRQHYSGNVHTRSADLLYDVGQRTVEKDKLALLTVSSASSRYQKKLVWHTDTREWVRVVLMITNPFKEPICPAPASLYKRGVLISRDNAEFVSPGTPIVLAAGHAPEIEVERSVDTSERLANRARPFTHATKFKVTNHGNQRIRLEVVMPKKFGSRHKTIYRFKRKPDRRPGEMFIWELDLKKDQTNVIAFSFDSEHARFPGYQTYEKARYEMH